jgi:hypothetical protein
MKAPIPLPQPSFRTEEVDFFPPVRSCALLASRMVLRDEPVGLRRETSSPSRAFYGMNSLFDFAVVGAAFLGGPVAQSGPASLFSALSVSSAPSVLNLFLPKADRDSQ